MLEQGLLAPLAPGLPAIGALREVVVEKVTDIFFVRCKCTFENFKVGIRDALVAVVFLERLFGYDLLEDGITGLFFISLIVAVQFYKPKLP